MDMWQQVLGLVEKRTSSQVFEVWFKPTSLEKFDPERHFIQVRVPNQHYEYWLKENYADLLKECLEEIALKDCQLTFVPPGNGGGDGPGLHPKYTFDSFVVGFCNQFAHAACRAVAEQPSKAYNPLFLYGGVGLGKTHLMHAIGHDIAQRRKGVRLLYISSERFVNDLIHAIRYDLTLQFRETYRNIDVLLMDDVQFLASKERTQEEFFHTFNALYDAQKQIVVSSDAPPKEIPTLEERLHSRFEWGLIADIQPPDLETKLAILHKKAELEKTSLPDDVSLFIASNVKSNVRELEGSLIRLLAFSSLTGQQINLALAERVLKHLVDKNSRLLTTEHVQKTVADFFGLKASELRARNNSRRIAEPRQIAMYLCRELIGCSLTDIGRDFGGKHHTTVLHSIRKVQEARPTDTKINSALNRLTDLLR
jgi:chromosomal replication initiator protein